MFRASTLAAVLLATIALMAASLSAQAGRLVADRFASPALGRDWDYLAYLPDGHETGRLRYPVLYLLHGYGQDRYEWVTKGQVQRLADAMIRDGEIPPCVIVMPSAGTSWYLDGPEKMETAVMGDLLPEMERRYRLIGERLGRAIGGVSMGGYGALRLALRYPERFAAAALLSPAIYAPEPPASSAARRSLPFQRDGRFDADLWRSLNYPALLDAFADRGLVVPLHLASGDQDEFQSEYQAAALYKVWRDRGWPAQLRIGPGEHNFGAWRPLLPEALRFVLETVLRPQPVEPAGPAAATAGP